VKRIIDRLIEDFERGKLTRRQLIQSLSIAATASVASGSVALAGEKSFQATGVNHISYSVPDYAKTRDFYADLLGMQPRGDTGEQCTLRFGDSFIVVRKTESADHKAYVDHFAITIDNWNKEEVEAELKRRGLQPTLDGNSFHVRDPDGFDLQISGGRPR
jgi:catechol 2,3-dioxygenase-like lactoylglutathione lyase family enzyme